MVRSQSDLSDSTPYNRARVYCAQVGQAVLKVDSNGTRSDGIILEVNNERRRLLVAVFRKGRFVAGSLRPGSKPYRSPLNPSNHRSRCPRCSGCSRRAALSPAASARHPILQATAKPYRPAPLNPADFMQGLLCFRIHLHLQ